MNPQLELNEIFTLKMTSGEELIAKVIEINGNFATISDPVSVAAGPKGMSLVPSLFTADPGKPIMINTNSVTIFGKTEESVRNKYIEVTTGIQIPDKKIIMG